MLKNNFSSQALVVSGSVPLGTITEVGSTVPPPGSPVVRSLVANVTVQAFLTVTVNSSGVNVGSLFKNISYVEVSHTCATLESTLNITSATID